MTTTLKTIVTKDLTKKKIFISREFAASRDRVWESWTKSSLLDLWWAPKPWKAITKTMNFKEGGHWLYCMAGPNGEQHWARVDYLTIDPPKSFTFQDSFCDEHGNKTSDLPSMHWTNKFLPIQTGTKVEVEISFAEEADVTKILAMGFEAGFTMALENLDELLAK